MDKNKFSYRILIYALWRIDLVTRRRVQLLRARYLAELRAIGRTGAWSLRADLGTGVQLYRIDIDGRIEPLVVRSQTVALGNTDGAVFPLTNEPARREAVRFHDWSPDGRWLWYVAFRNDRRNAPMAFDESVTSMAYQRRPRLTAEIELHLRSQDGRDDIVAVRPASDRLAGGLGGHVQWGSDLDTYATETMARDGSRRIEMASIDLATRAPRGRRDAKTAAYRPPALGPWNGTIASIGDGSGQRLVERLADGAVRSHGAFDGVLGDPRAPGDWRSRDGRSAILGVRMPSSGRYGLLYLGRTTRRLTLQTTSLTLCDFDHDLDRGICVREGLTLAPELVSVEPRRGIVRPIAAISPRHSAISPLAVTARAWQTPAGDRATGFILWPRKYRADVRHPAIVVTHGSDADERFASADFQWNYPVQLWAERGYIVLLINDPQVVKGSRRASAYSQWLGGGGSMTPAEMRQLLWLSNVAFFETAVDELVASGAIDPLRVGLAGYSRGSQVTNVAMTHSTRFRAASSGDGSYLEPYAYPLQTRAYDAIFGGSPYGPAITAYRDLSPSLRADRGRGAVLQQVAVPAGGMIEFHRALRAAGRPASFTLYPGEDARSDETHLFHVPANRLLAMRENVAWFDYWLRGLRSETMPFPGRYDQWEAMAGEATSPVLP